MNVTGKCPNCRSIFDARSAIVSFPGRVTGMKIYLVFALCPNCNLQLINADHSDKTEIIKTCYFNVLEDHDSDWTITASLALDAHWGDFYSAWWYGIDTPRPLFDAINEGIVDAISSTCSWRDL